MSKPMKMWIVEYERVNLDDNGIMLVAGENNLAARRAAHSQMEEWFCHADLDREYPKIYDITLMRFVGDEHGAPWHIHLLEEEMDD